MISAKWCAILASMVLGLAFVAARAEDAPVTQPSDTETPAPRKVRLFKPYSLLTDLTDDQKEKIAAIHKTYNEALAALKAKQTTDIEALLTDDQKKELAAAQTDSADQANADKKETQLETKVNADQEKLDKAKAAAGKTDAKN